MMCNTSQVAFAREVGVTDGALSGWRKRRHAAIASGGSSALLLDGVATTAPAAEGNASVEHAVRSWLAAKHVRLAVKRVATGAEPPWPPPLPKDTTKPKETMKPQHRRASHVAEEDPSLPVPPSAPVLATATGHRTRVATDDVAANEYNAASGTNKRRRSSAPDNARADSPSPVAAELGSAALLASGTELGAETGIVLALSQYNVEQPWPARVVSSAEFQLYFSGAHMGASDFRIGVIFFSPCWSEKINGAGRENFFELEFVDQSQIHRYAETSRTKHKLVFSTCRMRDRSNCVVCYALSSCLSGVPLFSSSKV